MQVAHRPFQHTLVLPVGIVQPPVPAHRTFVGTLPRLVEGLDQVVVPAIGLCHAHKTTNEARFIDPAGHCRLALAAFAGPAGFTNQDVLGRKARTEHPAYIGDMGQGLVDALGVVLPVGQQVNGEEVHRRCHLRVLQPELPDIGVGHRHVHLAFHPGDQRGQVCTGHLLAQQGFVADDHCADHVGVGIGGGDQQVDFPLGVGGVRIDPGPQHHLQAVLARQRRYCFKTGHGIGANALKAFGQQGQVGIHALRAQPKRLVVGRLVLVERCVRGTLQLVCRARGIGQLQRLAKPVPERSQPQQGEQEGKQVQRQQRAGRTGHQAVHRQAQRDR